MKLSFLLSFVCIYLMAQIELFAKVTTANPIMFVTQTPTHGFRSVTQTFGNHEGGVDAAPRGGDLMIRYQDGTLRNLTREAGFGCADEMQNNSAIAVRQPKVHWNGKKALFSMVIGNPTKNLEVGTYYWQIYEVTGFDKGETVKITKVANQPENYNNISPIYGSDDKIIFTSDMAFNEARYLYPQHDEYESSTVVSGLWSLDPVSGEVKLLQHSPSGSFNPMIDSYGRLLYTRWDHLQRDQQADAERKQSTNYGTFNYSDESETAQKLNNMDEVFPEPRDITSPDYDKNISLMTFNQFFPWMINQDGTEEETINHVGRHEFGGTYTEGSFKDDKNLNYVIPKSYIKNKVFLPGDGGLFQMIEDPSNRGIYYGISAREFFNETAGQVLKFTGAPDVNPEDMEIFEITHKSTAYGIEDGKTPDPNYSGHYRNIIPLTNGDLIVSHSQSPFINKQLGTDQFPKIRYNFRLKTLAPKQIAGQNLYESDKYLTDGIVRKLKYYNSNNYIVERTDTLWELDPVEVVAQQTPPLKLDPPMPQEEKSIFTEEGVDETKFRKWMSDNKLALLVSRNVTTRDRADVSQPYNLKVTNGVQSIANAGKSYEIQYMQFMQGDMLRGKGGLSQPRPGRRILAQPMHDEKVKNPILKNSSPIGSVQIAQDGSMAAFVPAQRAMTWHLTDPNGKSVVKERYWVTFQPGEIRTCASCHGLNKQDQTGKLFPQNKPEALRELLKFWKYSETGIATNNDGNSKLEQNMPNPFQLNTTIGFYLPFAQFAELKLYNINGIEVAILTSGEMEAGQHQINFSNQTNNLPSGVYYYTLRASDFIETKLMTIGK